jgi:DNA-binding response OmpR family regulator
MSALQGVRVSALLVGGSENDRAFLRHLFRQSRWNLFRARNRRHAAEILQGNRVQVVISDCDLPGFDWRELLDALRAFPQPPLLVVTARLADESLWAEVLNRGGYDVLAQPLDREEVTRVMSAATRHFHNACEQALRVSAPLVMSAAG